MLPFPKSYHDAFNGSSWENAMRDEYNALVKNNTWTLVPRPPDTNVRYMWLFRHKYLADGSFSRYKAHLVVNGSTQLEGIDVDETFILIVKPDLVKTHYCFLTSGVLYDRFGSLNYYLGISVTRDSLRMFLSQKKYSVEILEGAGMVNCNPSQTPVDTKSKLGATGDMVSDPTLYQSLAVLVAYSDADWAGCPTTRRSTLANDVAETCWLKNHLRELHTPLSYATLVNCDNISAVYLSFNPVRHQRTKNIEIDIYFVRELVICGHVRVPHVPSCYRYADIFTKGMSVKNALVIQRCELLCKELDDFLSSNSIPSEYHVILPMPTQTILDSPRGYTGLYTHFFPLANLRLPLNDFFYELLLKENMVGVKSFKDKLLFEMSFRNFIYTEDDKDLTFLPKDISPSFNIGSPSVSINTEPGRANEEPVVEPTTKHVPVNERGEECKTSRDSSRPPVKRKVASSSSTSRTVRTKASALKDDTFVLSIYEDDKGLKDYLELKDAIACHLKISAITPPVWKGFLDNHLDLDLLDLPDRCYARQAVVDNVVNRRSRELLEVIKKLRGEAYVVWARELAHEEEYETLQDKCEASMTYFEKNTIVLLLREKMSLLAAEAKEHKGNLDRLMLESQKWSGIEKVKHDRREVVSKFVHYACMELLYSDELGRLVGKLVSSAITFGRCRAYEQVARMKESFDLSKDLLSKKPLTLQKPIPSRTQMHVLSSQLATPSSAPALKRMYPPADIVKPYPSLNE
nr:hypothetical protein [Tanacetum cinerariifolium]GEV81923.1 hypothetical protein [Tanacetum cinerariifolium]